MYGEFLLSELRTMAEWKDFVVPDKKALGKDSKKQESKGAKKVTKKTIAKVPKKVNAKVSKGK